MAYHFSKTVNLDFDEAIKKVTDELKKKGFGIITEIDMQDTLKKKLDVDFRRYTILGACNPRYAYKALQQEDKVGILLPCNVAVQEHPGGKTEISIGNPEELMKSVEDETLQILAAEIKDSLQQVLQQC